MADDQAHHGGRAVFLQPVDDDAPEPLVPVPQSGALGDVLDPRRLTREALANLRASKAESTLKAYNRDLKEFQEWCDARGLGNLPADPETVANYLSWLEDSTEAKVATIRRAASAISYGHRVAGFASPTSHQGVSEVLAGIARKRARAGERQRQKEPLLGPHIEAMIRAALKRGGMAGLRDRALILLGWHTACRRAELVAFDVEHLRWADGGVLVTIPVSKGDQEGQRDPVAVAPDPDPVMCPVATTRLWLAESGITTGAVFRQVHRSGRVVMQAHRGKPGGAKHLEDARLSTNAVADLLKRYADAADVPRSLVAGHSLRSGHATWAAMNDAPLPAIQHQLGHKTPAMTMRYARLGRAVADSSSNYLRHGRDDDDR